jgi:hypothetical protein
MRPVRLDDRTASRLLAGAVTPEDAPPGYAGAAQLLDSARPRPASAPLAREAATVASMRAAILGHPVPVFPRRKPMLAKLLTAKAAAVVAVAALAATGAAAATGSLPGVNSHAGSHPNSPNTPNSSTPTTGPNAHADFGLCTAEKAAAGHPNSAATVFPSSSTCSGVAHPGSANDTNGQGSPPSSIPGPPSSVPAGPPSGTPGSSHAPVNTPNQGSNNATGSAASSAGAGNSSNRGRP